MTEGGGEPAPISKALLIDCGWLTQSEPQRPWVLPLPSPGDRTKLLASTVAVDSVGWV